MSDQLIVIVNYHYLREQSVSQGIHALSIEDFERQLDLVSEEGYDFIALAELNGAVENGSLEKLPAKSCLITFDDGLRESYLNGLSVLDRKGIPGAFFVVSDTLVSEKVLAVHKFHFVRNQLSDPEILSILKDKLEISQEDLVSDAVLTEQYPWDPIEGARLKYIFNFLLSDEKKEELTDFLFAYLDQQPERAYARHLYMSHDQIIDLSRRGYLGTHSNNHRPLSLLSAADLRQDIETAMSVLFNLTQTRVQSISYPYGGLSAVNSETGDECRRLGLVSGLTMYRGINTEQDILFNPMLLKRLDMNDMLGGKSQQIYKELIHAKT